MVLIPSDRPPTHPGEVLREEFLAPLKLTGEELARRTGLPPETVGELVQGERGITPDAALRLARFLGTTPEFWLNAQLAWDLYHAMNSPEAADIEAIQPLTAPA
jgi:addiction module HigA family antidote